MIYISRQQNILFFWDKKEQETGSKGQFSSMEEEVIFALSADSHFVPMQVLRVPNPPWNIIYLIKQS